MEEKKKFLVIGRDTRIEQKHQQSKLREDEVYKKEVNQSVSLALNLGFSIALPIIAGVFAGRWLDSVFHTAPGATLLFLFLGAALGVAQMVVLIKNNNQNGSQNSKVKIQNHK